MHVQNVGSRFRTISISLKESLWCWGSRVCGFDGVIRGPDVDRSRDLVHLLDRLAHLLPLSLGVGGLGQVDRARVRVTCKYYHAEN